MRLSDCIGFTPTHKCTTLAGYLFKAAKGFFVSAPNATKQTSLKELTLRGIILGGILAIVAIIVLIVGLVMVAQLLGVGGMPAPAAG